MKILFITSSFEDYLQDQLLIGLRTLLGDKVIDYPQKDVLYVNSPKDKHNLYGCGFTIWKSLPDIKIDRSNIFRRIQKNEFTLIIFGSIWRQKSVFKKVVFKNSFRNRTKLIFIDGEDHTMVYKKALPFGRYFKREQSSNLMSLFVRKINFSIPPNKIKKVSSKKNKPFAKHNQCDEAYKIEDVKNNCQRSYAFNDETLYYDDIAQSEFAITMKKGGWDCMRHYEIAANLTVPCFYKLDTKNKNCAPHGLIDLVNVISFDTASELERKINLIRDNNLYSSMQLNVKKWIEANSCTNAAKQLLSNVGLPN